MTQYCQRVTRADGRTINVVQRRGHLSYCYGACCCGRTDRGYAAVPVEVYKEEWLKRKVRNIVNMTKGGCLGSCPLANVVSLEFDGPSVFFQSVSQPWQVRRLIFDYIESMIRADGFLPPPPELVVFTVDFYDWKVRPRHAEAIAPETPINPNLIAFLSHAGTDLVTLDRARPDLPAVIRVLGLPLLSIVSDEQMLATLSGELAEAAVVLLRIHRRLEAIPAVELLRQRMDDWQKQADPAKPVAAILFYRARLLSGNTGFRDALSEALCAGGGLEPLCIFTSSLKDQRDGAPTAFCFFPTPPSVVISTLSFAHGDVHAGGITEPGANVNALKRLDVPILQTMAAGMPQTSWELSSRGLNPFETAINVAIPEFDGRIITVPVSFKERQAGHDGALYTPHAERIARVAGIAAQVVKLRQKPNGQKRVAFVLTNSSSKAAQVGNAVGLDAPASLLKPFQWTTAKLPSFARPFLKRLHFATAHS